MTTFEFEGKDYTLKMTRAGVRAAEAQGLSSSQITEKPFSAFVLLFFASLFSQYHLNPSKVASMLDTLLDAGTIEFQPIFEELAEAYADLFGSGESEK
jgi:hypothetical protein